MRQLPNIVSASRGLAAIGLLITSTFSAPFWIIYAWCGISDMIDGPLARRLGAESRTGAILDSAADLIFVAAAAIKVLPVLSIPRWIWTWIAIIALIRVSNIILGYVQHKRLVMLHTGTNKLTGLLLFLLPAAIQASDHTICVAAICIVATISSVQECIKIVLSHNPHSCGK